MLCAPGNDANRHSTSDFTPSARKNRSSAERILWICVMASYALAAMAMLAPSDGTSSGLKPGPGARALAQTASITSSAALVIGIWLSLRGGGGRLWWFAVILAFACWILFAPLFLL